LRNQVARFGFPFMERLGSDDHAVGK